MKYALLSHKSTSALRTKVTTTDGVVHVTGDAHSDAEKSLVSKLAMDVRGIKVRDQRHDGDRLNPASDIQLLIS